MAVKEAKINKYTELLEEGLSYFGTFFPVSYTHLDVYKRQALEMAMLTKAKSTAHPR